MFCSLKFISVRFIDDEISCRLQQRLHINLILFPVPFSLCLFSEYFFFVENSEMWTQ